MRGASRAAGAGSRRVNPTCGTASAPRCLCTAIKALSGKRFLPLIQPFTSSHCKNTRVSVSRAVVLFCWWGFLPSLRLLCSPVSFFLFFLFSFLTKKRYTAQEFRTSLQLTSQVNRFSAKTGYIYFRNVCN